MFKKKQEFTIVTISFSTGLTCRPIAVHNLWLLAIDLIEYQMHFGESRQHRLFFAGELAELWSF